MLQSRILVMLVLCWLSQSTGRAESGVFGAEHAIAKDLSLIIGIYVQDHNGTPPSKWEDLPNRDILERTARQLGQPYTELFRFENRALPKPHAGKLILISARPTKARTEGPPFRWTVCQDEQGKVVLRALSEEEAAVVLGLPPLPPPAPRLVINAAVTNPNASLYAGEPVCVRFEASSTKTELPASMSFAVVVAGPNGEITTDLRSWHLLGNSKDKIAVEFLDGSNDTVRAQTHLVLWPVLDPRKELADIPEIPIFTASPGQYRLTVKELRTGTVSPEVTFTVVEPPADETAARSLFTSRDAVEAFLGRLDPAPSYTQLIEQHPNSRYAAYAALILARSRYVSQKLETSDDRQALDGLVQLLDKTLVLGFRSGFEATALYLKAQCLRGAENVDQVRQLLQTLVRDYDGFQGLSGATSRAAKWLTEMPVQDHPPQITVLGANPMTIECGDVYADAGAKATDDKDGDITARIVVENNVDTPQVGTYQVIYRVTDSAGDAATATRTVKVVYKFDGFLAPIGGADATGGSYANPVRTFKLGSTIPVKFKISCGNAAVKDGAHTLQVIKYNNETTSQEPIDATPTDAATTGNQFKLSGDEWHFNLDTKATGMTTGTWQLKATLSDGSAHLVWIALK